MNKNKPVIAERIRLLRKEKKLTQEQLSAQLQVRECDITRSALAKIEVGQRHLYPDEIRVLKELLDVVKQYETHMNEYCLNGIAEIFDGLTPDVSRGCSNQAWSIGELLRACYENLIFRGYKK